MPMPQLQTLNDRFAINDHLQFVVGHGGMPIVAINNALGKASIALQGAHLLDFQAEGEQPLIWMSDDATFAAGKSLRGGIPVCWPWFGPHPTDSSQPSHGPARTTMWSPVSTASLNDGSHAITLAWEPADSSLQVKLHITIGSLLSLTLETTNRGSDSVELSEALHSYFRVGDVRQAYIEGLESCDYIDKVDGFTRKQQHGAITISTETDRIYLNTQQQCAIIDPSMQRKIIITSAGSQSTVVWNPWIEQAAKMGDLGQDGYLHMLCVETANAADNVIQLAAGSSHSLTATYATAHL